MIHQRLVVLVLLLAGVMPGLGSGSVRAAPVQGHGGGPGHALRGFYPGGFYGGFRPGFRRFYGYPGWYGVGLGVGFGCAYAYGYPYYPYPYGCAYPVWVDPYGAPTAVAYPPPEPGAVQGAVPAAGGPGPIMPVRLTEMDVLLSVRVPPDASVWINGEKTTQSGPRREFLSSGLSPGRSYTFVVAARWTGPDGNTVDRQRRISVQGGERRNIDFIMLAPPTEGVPAIIEP